MIETIVTALWLVIPAYVPNSTAVLFKGKIPIDLNRDLWDGKRILGDGKTFRGFVGGGVCGTLAGLIQIYLGGPLSLPTFNENILIVASLAFGALLGDMAASFFKRRLNKKRGAPFPLVDQLDFLVGALLLTIILYPGWFTENFTLPIIAVVFVLTPIIHITVNYFGYKMGVKNEPW
ncbi:CDP-2,3-bis-(O-geranylgeranyl)-sn-glycerol synthase [Methanonatronarchaeum sp. AMET6-2]|uniref:CDP-2,3-bis-(O-geranylgeranyl)-sn-glycerol synthase n=1 Tax=Methanonatronarchaeum sp. AMET6-2 TaxID=2933293 RepID=UPI001228F059|nr:CDP-2,3-bis-(O-geranylgeranyl)-sn-glycerol synthase [Methanonatronarchaeum sp. AMET6-2]RZN63073.1 MAG: CDP-2,3-bis-(O-geranylgeranyl)-sn-glycerol synthase [Methanonatronarchaeia archaeon]UOY09592.1 CDP-2,3-bis-(O-geranylgeranyl)-sn-glycerol synthase [Methanonatronarchaeum sp. AMET6-2]